MGKEQASRRMPDGIAKLLWPLAALGGLLLFNMVFTPGFFHLEMKDGHLFGSLIDVVNRAAPVMLVSLGMTLVLATGGVDLSVGAIMAITGSIAALLINRGDIPFAGVVGISLLAALVAGSWNGMLVSLLNIQPIVATLILMVAGRGVAQLLTNGQIITFENKPFESLGGGFFMGLPFSVTLVLLTLAAIGIASRRTAMGLFVESVGGNATASRLAGINASLVKFLVYALCGVCAGLAGLVVTSDIKGADANNAGMYLELDAILAVVIGGTSLNGGRFYLVGSLVGALLIQALTTTILTKGLPVQFTLVVKAIVILVVCLLQSESARKTIFARLGGKR